MTEPLFTRTDALTQGYTDRDLAAARRRGRIEVLRPGRYAPAETLGALSAEGRHALLVRACLSGLADPLAVSHESGAVLGGLDQWDPDLSAVHITRPGRSRRTRTLVCHQADLLPSDVRTIDGLPVTSAARTVVDLARTRGVEAGLCTADHALRTGVGPEEMRFVHARTARHPGSRDVARVLDLADGRSESVGESRSRLLLLRAGLTGLDLQVEIPVEGGRVHRVDFALPELGICGEFDGRVKYGRLLRAGQDAGDVVFAEKQREDRIREAGWLMVRWVWAELVTPRVVLARWSTAITRRTGRAPAIRPVPLLRSR